KPTGDELVALDSLAEIRGRRVLPPEGEHPNQLVMKPVSFERGQGHDGERCLPRIEPSREGSRRRPGFIDVVLDVADARHPHRPGRGVVDPDAGIVLRLDGELNTDLDIAE